MFQELSIDATDIILSSQETDKFQQLKSSQNQAGKVLFVGFS